jgi:endonuclease/exonuclease/phosphatase family metal-dependent hydrolase
VAALPLLQLAGCAAPSATFVDARRYAASCDDAAPSDGPLKIASYNIKSGLWSSLAEVAAVLADIDAVVLALEEVDNELPRSGGVDQSKHIATSLGAERLFAGAWDSEGGSYGIALLSKLPILRAERFDLPASNGFEPRVGIDALVCAGGRPLNVVATHADFLPWAAAAHAEALGERVADRSDVVLMGDFNIPPEHESIRGIVRDGLTDAIALFTNEPTFAQSRIDYVFTDRKVSDARVVDSAASDHRPVWTTMQLD